MKHRHVYDDNGKELCCMEKRNQCVNEVIQKNSHPAAGMGMKVLEKINTIPEALWINYL